MKFIISLFLILLCVFTGGVCSTLLFFHSNGYTLYTPKQIEIIKTESWMEGYHRRQLDDLPAPQINGWWTE